MMPNDVKIEFMSRLIEVGLFVNPTVEKTLYLTGKLSSIMFKMGDKLSKNWWWFVAINTFGGYVPNQPIELQHEKIKDWVSKPREHSYFGDKKKYLDLIYTYSTEFLRKSPSVTQANTDMESTADFLGDLAKWARSGSTSTKSTIYSTDGKRIRKSKWTTAFGLEVEEVRRIVATKEKKDLYGKMDSTAIQKRETKKIRAVIMSGDYPYLKMAVVMRWFERAARNHPNTTLFYSKEQTNEMWRTMVRNHSDKYSVKMPLDQEEFDHQPTFEMQRKVWHAMKDYLRVQCKVEFVEEMEEIMDSLERMMFDLPRFVRFHELLAGIPSIHGIESGIRITAWMDTIINWCELRIAEEMARDQKVPVVSKIEVAQGDDDNLEFLDFSMTLAVYTGYLMQGLKVNPSKFWMAYDRNEYLRRVTFKDRIQGYPARAINSVLWRNPVSRDPPKGKDRSREQVSNWSTLISRGCVEKEVVKHMVRDICRGNGLSKKDVYELLETPMCVGGLGFFACGNNFGLAIDTEVEDFSNHVDLNTVVGVDWLLQKWEEFDLGMEKSSLQREIDSVFNMSTGEHHVTVKRVAVPIGYLKYAVPSKIIPTKCPVNRDLPQTFITSVLDKMIRDRDWDKILNTYVAIEWREIAEKIMKRGGRRVFIDWLKGSLPFAVPIVPLWDKVAVSEEAEKINSTYWSWLVFRHRFNYSSVTRAAVSAEGMTRDWISRQEPRIGA
jgi:hypothetical protein